MRFEVPQFIEIEDKIFGPFTWKQFVYLSGGVGLGAVIFFTLPFFFFVLIGAPLGGLAVLLAFYPVNNRPFSNFLEAIVTFYNGSRVYHWRKKSTVVYSEKTSTPSSVKTPVLSSNGTTGIRALAAKLELNTLTK
jgi:hypothetical protein